jgi:hypothetical protein
MRDNGRDEYGAVTTGAEVNAALGIVEPSIGTRAQFQAIEIAILSAVDQARAALLKEGKYLQGVKGNYRVLLPSENLAQVRSYHQQAIRKIKRGDTLLQNTGAAAIDPLTSSRERARLLRWATSAKDAQDRNDVLQ